MSFNSFANELRELGYSEEEIEKEWEKYLEDEEIDRIKENENQ